MTKQVILIVDDSPTILSILKEMLKGNDFAVRTARSGEEALEKAAKAPPDLILLDIEMPGIDGFETCRRFKKDKKLFRTPILFLSSFEDVTKKVSAFKAGGVDYISKPVQRAELAARLKTHLKLKRLQGQLYREIADKEHLIHILCHDVSNPLTCIEGWIEIALENEIIKQNKDLESKMRRISQSSQQAVDIIEHVKEMEALSRQKKELQLEPVAIEDVIGSALIIFENRLKDKNITFKCDPPLNNVSAKVLAEKVSFTSSVFNNLFSNTIKFSYPGSVITLLIEEKEKEVHLILKDEGIGIPAAYLEAIFDPGSSVSRTGTAGENGSGFGMPLVKKYMDRYGGQIIIRSRPEEEFPQRHGTEIILILKNAGKLGEKR
ncbi:MAG: hybrid sensor histidine kinase/response regulator [Candidatus Aminicenantes bacterium]|nr:hybrid sensor histidine kinase/response regulator [Candidatus Aminicenantes bacterium]